MNFLLWIYTAFLLVTAAEGTKHLSANSLLTCSDNSQASASYFDVVFYPQNNSLVFDIQGISNINGVKVSADVELIAYGLKVVKQTVDLCKLLEYKQLCPLTSGHLDISFTYKVSKSITKKIPGVAYTIPDLDARVRIAMYETKTKNPLACVEAVVNNGKTVQTKYAAWPIAAIAGLGLITSGVVSVIGHSNTAAHIASNSMSLFVYFQSLAITSMLAVAKVPPIASAWSQNFQWSLGVIRAEFIQKIANWYLQATGGTPTDILDNSHLSISVQKIKRGTNLLAEAANTLANVGRPNFLQKRASISVDSDNFGLSDQLNSTLYTTDERGEIGSKVLILRGIQRVAYLAGIEISDLYMTTIIFLLFFVFVVVVCMTFFKAAVEICIRSKIMNEGKFNEYRQQWANIIKGALYRLLLVALPQVAVLSFWEFTQHDSAGVVVVAVFLLLVTVGLLSYAIVRVVSFGRRSVKQHKNPALLLFGDLKFLNKFGFVYVQFRADCYYFVACSFAYTIIKTLFVAVLQGHGRVQAVLVFVVELFYCVAVCWKRPFMDKRTNVFNITIAVINTINALFFMFFSYVFNQPQVVASVMAVVYFVVNAVFALFLLIFTIVTCVLALVYKNPDTRYQPMKDDRVSFLPRIGPTNGKGTEAQDNMELVALGASAMKGLEHAQPLQYGEDESFDDEDSSNKKNAYSLVYNDSGSLSKNSLAETLEPQHVASTIVGNSTNAYQNFQTSYTGRHDDSIPYKGYYDQN